jgi:histidyl-tRNA synthetase
MKFQTVRGMRDFLPKEMQKKQFIEDTCRQVFELFGFKPLQTPVVEDLRLLTAKGAGGEEIKKEIYAFKDQSGREIGLRFDFTVPLGRVVAGNPQLVKPFKRYQIGTVYRYDRPGKGRWREFTQADIDIIGSNSMLAETECLLATKEVFKRIGLKVKVRVNNRKLLEDIAELNGVKKTQTLDCFRCLDKLEKFGRNAVEKELKQKGISTEILEVIERNSFKEIEEEFERKKIKSKGLQELKELLELMEKTKAKDFMEIDLRLARGLDYYTGTVFEVSTGKGNSVGGGGRYDQLVELYGGTKQPAVGISFGVDRILELIAEKLPEKPVKLVFLAPIGQKIALKALELLQELRRKGIPAEIDLMNRSVSKNLEYANKQGIAFVIVLGEKELKEKKFKAKEMSSGKETIIGFNELSKLKELVKK